MYDTIAATAATPITAISVVNLMIRSAAFIGHRRQAQTLRPKGMSEGFLVQSVLGSPAAGCCSRILDLLFIQILRAWATGTNAEPNCGGCREPVSISAAFHDANELVPPEPERADCSGNWRNRHGEDRALREPSCSPLGLALAITWLMAAISPFNG